MVIRQGEVWWADISEPIGSAPGFTRPVVVVQSDAMNRSRIGTVVCVPLTSNLKWASAPGCNADSAAQYTLAIIWLACERSGRQLADQTAGIIGRGNVGSRVMYLLNSLGVETVANDPPLADAGEEGLVSLDEALRQDIVCLHVPLERLGPYPTVHLLNEKTLAATRDGAMLVNSARGAVIDGEALKRHIDDRNLCAALDVWPGEPAIDAELVSACCVATPHVAGYSNDGKFSGANQIYRAFCAWFGEPEYPMPPLPGGDRQLTLDPDKAVISQALQAACFVARHDQAMRRLAELPRIEIPLEFDRLRREYPTRRDFKGWAIRGANSNQANILRKLGFCVGNTVNS